MGLYIFKFLFYCFGEVVSNLIELCEGFCVVGE